MAQPTRSEQILDRLAAGESLTNLRREMNLKRIDVVTAALYGITELREEYLTLLAKRRARR